MRDNANDWTAITKCAPAAVTNHSQWDKLVRALKLLYKGELAEQKKVLDSPPVDGAHSNAGARGHKAALARESWRRVLSTCFLERRPSLMKLEESLVPQGSSRPSLDMPDEKSVTECTVGDRLLTPSQETCLTSANTSSRGNDRAYPGNRQKYLHGNRLLQLSDAPEPLQQDWRCGTTAMCRTGPRRNAVESSVCDPLDEPSALDKLVGFNDEAVSVQDELLQLYTTPTPTTLASHPLNPSVRQCEGLDGGYGCGGGINWLYAGDGLKGRAGNMSGTKPPGPQRSGKGTTWPGDICQGGSASCALSPGDWHLSGPWRTSYELKSPPMTARAEQDEFSDYDMNLRPACAGGLDSGHIDEDRAGDLAAVREFGDLVGEGSAGTIAKVGEIGMSRFEFRPTSCLDKYVCRTRLLSIFLSSLVLLSGGDCCNHSGLPSHAPCRRQRFHCLCCDYNSCDS